MIYSVITTSVSVLLGYKSQCHIEQTLNVF